MKKLKNLEAKLRNYIENNMDSKKISYFLEKYNKTTEYIQGITYILTNINPENFVSTNVDPINFDKYNKHIKHVSKKLED